MFRLEKSELMEPELVDASTWKTEEEGTVIEISPLVVLS
jgi:hypothetical protein